LILHEIIYQEGRDSYSHSNSVNSRYFNSMLTSTNFANASLSDYANLVYRSGLKLEGFSYVSSGKTYTFLYANQICETRGLRLAQISSLETVQSFYPNIMAWLEAYGNRVGASVSANYVSGGGSLEPIELVFGTDSVEWQWGQGKNFNLCENAN